MKKRFLAMALVLVMMIGCMPMYAYTNEPEFEYHYLDSLLLPPEINPSYSAEIQSAMSPFAVESDVLHNSLTIDDVVAKEKELSHSGFNRSKVTQYAVAPNLTAPYSAGSLNADDVADALKALKMVRYLAGLSYENVTFAPTQMNSAQHKAVLMAVSEYGHHPPKPADMEQDFYDTANNFSAECIYAGVSNISYSILGFIADSGDNNIEQAGHRMILLRPAAQNYGIGYAQNPSPGAEWRHLIAVHVSYLSAQTDSYIAWPNAGDFPIQYFINNSNLNYQPPYPWSLTIGSAYQTPSRTNISLKLTRTRDNKVWILDKNSPNMGITGLTNASTHLAVNGNNIIFRPDVTSLGPILDGDVFKVELSGIKYTDGTDATLDYEIRFFDLDKEMNRSRVNITVKNADVPVSGATVEIDGQMLTTDLNGVASLRLDNNTSHSYTVTKSGYNTATGSIAVGINTVFVDVPVFIPVDFTITDVTKTYDGTAQSVRIAARPDVSYTVKYDNSAAAPKNVGTYNVVVEANAAGYTGSKTATFTINKARLTVTAEDKKITYGDSLPAWTIGYSGFAYGENENDLSVRPSVTLETEGKINAGTHNLAISGAVSDNYEFYYINGVMSVDKKDVSISGLSVFDKEYKSGDVSATVKDFVYSIDGMVSGDDVRIDIDALTAAFEDDAVGNAKNVTISGIVLIGGDRDNYNLISPTITVTADIKPEVTAKDIADAITSIPLLARDATQIVLPAVPPGFTIGIKTSSGTAIGLDGSVSPVDADTLETIVLYVTKISNETTADTSAINVTILASTKHTIAATAGVGGAVDGGGIYNKNSKVVLTAAANLKYLFDGWYEDDMRILDAEETYSFTAVADRVLEARFVLDTKGHVLGNDKIGIGDAQLAFRAALKLVELTPEQLYAADIDGNGRVDMSDAMRIFRYALGLSTEL